MKRPTTTRKPGAVVLRTDANTPPAEADTRRRTRLSDESARATAKATMASNFPAPPALAEQLGDQVIAEIRAELAAEAADRGAVTTTETDEA